MKIYAPYQYPDPELFEVLSLDQGNRIAVTARYHRVEDGRDLLAHVPVYLDAPLKNAPDGALLIDIWSDDDDRDWLASTVFVMNEDVAELAQSRVFGGWQGVGLLPLMIVVAQELTGWTRKMSGLERVEVW